MTMTMAMAMRMMEAWFGERKNGKNKVKASRKCRAAGGKELSERVAFNSQLLTQSFWIKPCVPCKHIIWKVIINQIQLGRRTNGYYHICIQYVLIIMNYLLRLVYVSTPPPPPRSPPPPPPFPPPPPSSSSSSTAAGWKGKQQVARRGGGPLVTNVTAKREKRGREEGKYSTAQCNSLTCYSHTNGGCYHLQLGCWAKVLMRKKAKQSRH